MKRIYCTHPACNIFTHQTCILKTVGKNIPKKMYTTHCYTYSTLVYCTHSHIHTHAINLSLTKMVRRRTNIAYAYEFIIYTT